MVAKSTHKSLTFPLLFLIEASLENMFFFFLQDFDHYSYVLHLVDDVLWVNTLGGFKEDFSKYLVGQSIASLIFVKKDL